MLKEFKDFAMKGSVIDLAVGMIIGTAFSAITKSLVADVITPLLNPLLGGIDFKDWVIGDTIKIGLFINAVISFIIMAFVIFIIVKFINKLKKEEVKEEKPKGPTELELLQEIRDSLKK